ncbi:hypothetical protein PVAG01_03686 [Phlyctema vagabunda]|uniref:DUF2306 domain-containing protein n=1 Tax=Phlyctema vagabunda TaxID=108571 RepID=A0ABR4PM46_9HELO
MEMHSNPSRGESTWSDQAPKHSLQSQESGGDIPEQHPGKFVAFMRKIYRPLGFQKGYNFPLWFIFAGAMFGFSLARSSYMNISGDAYNSYKNGASPGEWYWYRRDHYRIGITMHIVTVIPAGLLMVWQFVPVIRHKALIVHRINGYVIMVLVLFSLIGALMIARRAFGGTAETQAGIGALVILTFTSMVMAWLNIKRLQIDQHRAWMLRGMFYLGTIITLRIIMVISAFAMTAMNNYYTTMPCDEILYLHDGNQAELLRIYPQCSDIAALEGGRVVVKASMTGGYSENVGASLGLPFGMALWLALLMHLIGVEMYLSLTTRETERLRQVSYERQLERGFKNPGSAGLTSDRWGDVQPWTPARVGK